MSATIQRYTVDDLEHFPRDGKIAGSVEITRELGRSETVSDAILWRPPTLDVDVRIELSDIFAGIE